jgi:LysM repeat protein
MKKQALFAVCLTAVSAAIFTGCATKQDAMNKQSQMEATEITAAETQAVEADVNAEPTPEVTPAPTTVEPAPAPAPQTIHPQPVEYIVTAGDSVSAIAVRFNVRRPDIMALNPTLSKNPNGLRIGQKVLLPAGTDVSKKAVRRPTSAAPANAKRPAGTTVYLVKPGDVLGGIAIKHGVTVAAIKSANNLKKDTIWAGQKLTIPAATKKPAAKAPAKKVAPAKKPAEKKTPVVTAEDKPEVAKEIPAPVVAPVVEDAPVAPAAPVEEEALPVQDGEDSILPPVPEAPAEVAAPAQSDRVYVVQEGDDLLSIAMRWQVSPAELRALNGLNGDADPKLSPGTTLRLPMPATIQ